MISAAPGPAREGGGGDWEHVTCLEASYSRGANKVWSSTLI